jgi:hypothetical protein
VARFGFPNSFAASASFAVKTLGLGFCYSDLSRISVIRVDPWSGFAFPITAIPVIFVALCLCPSARPHPGVDALLKTKGQPQFDRTVDRAVEAFFCVF